MQGLGRCFLVLWTLGALNGQSTNTVMPGIDHDEYVAGQCLPNVTKLFVRVGDGDKTPWDVQQLLFLRRDYRAVPLGGFGMVVALLLWVGAGSGGGGGGTLVDSFYLDDTMVCNVGNKKGSVGLGIAGFFGRGRAERVRFSKRARTFRTLERENLREHLFLG